MASTQEKNVQRQLYLLEANVSKVFDKFGVHVEGKDIEACHHNDQAIVKFSYRKGSLQVLRVKKDLKSMDPTELDFPEGTEIFINESLYGTNAKN